MNYRGRLPVVFMPHGGGPWPFVEIGFPKADVDRLAGYLRSVAAIPPQPPRALLVISAHWEEPVPTVMTSDHPGILYDYYGFPPESYEITWPAPGAPALAARVRQLLDEAGIENAADSERGYDHDDRNPGVYFHGDCSCVTTAGAILRAAVTEA